MSAFDWLTARPIAHRGWHDAAAGILENTPSAFVAAIEGRYGIECDLQVTADGEAMVHHDAMLGRLTYGEGRLSGMSTEELKRVPFRATQDSMITLPELCELVAGEVPLVLELKSEFDGDRRLVTRVTSVLTEYAGPAAAMSFDPEQVQALRELAPTIARGIVAERRTQEPDTGPMQRLALAHLLHAHVSQPQFVAYNVKDLPTSATRVARSLFGCPLLAWTVRTPEDRRRAERYADQMIFEGFAP